MQITMTDEPWGTKQLARAIDAMRKGGWLAGADTGAAADAGAGVADADGAQRPSGVWPSSSTVPTPSGGNLWIPSKRDARLGARNEVADMILEKIASAGGPADSIPKIAVIVAPLSISMRRSTPLSVTRAQKCPSGAMRMRTASPSGDQRTAWMMDMGVT